MKALRLPTCASAVAYLVRFRRPRDPPVFVFAVALLKGGRPPSGPGSLGAGRPWFRLFHVDANRISQVSRRSILYLCSAPRPRSNRRALTLAVTSILPPLQQQRRLRTTKEISGLTHAAAAPALLRFAFRVATHAQGWLPAGWLTFTGRASNPLDRYERFQSIAVILLSCSPDAMLTFFMVRINTRTPSPSRLESVG
jgi:hypothetical protein